VKKVAKWNDGMFELTDDKHYFVVESVILIKPTDDFMYREYSGYHHATKESAQIELCYARGDDWRDDIHDLIIREVN
jgi:hypothetical protein